MADKIVKLVDKNSNNLYPVAGAVIDNAVSTGAISSQAVTNAKIENGAVNGVENNATAIGTAKLALNTVGTPNLRDASVTSDKIDWTTLTPFIKVASGTSATDGAWPSLTFVAPTNGVFYATAVSGAMTPHPSGFASFDIRATGGLTKVLNLDGVIESDIKGAQCTALGVWTGAVKGQSYTFSVNITNGQFIMGRPVRLVVICLPGQQGV